MGAQLLRRKLNMCHYKQDNENKVFLILSSLVCVFALLIFLSLALTIPLIKAYSAKIETESKIANYNKLKKAGIEDFENAK
jgi:CHASE3 domain sensor protein